MDNSSLDPLDWDELRAQGHRMLDDMLDHLQHLRDRPVWKPTPDEVRQHWNSPLPLQGTPLPDLHAQFMSDVLPYAVGNAHPGFMGWVHGGGTPVGMLAEMLAAGLNANVGGRDQMPVVVERQIVQWMRELYGFPEDSSGIFVTGTSQANLMALWVARTARLGPEVKQNGLSGHPQHLIVYASKAVHGCIPQAMNLSGLGTRALRLIPVNDRFEMDLEALEQAVADDRKKGFTPFLVIGTAGTVDVGAVDDLNQLARFCAREKLWFHVDGAFGALLRLSPPLSTRVDGIESADSIAFDFHKWGQVPYDAGFLLVRHEAAHRETFSSPAAYLQRAQHGTAGGSPWPCDYGPDLSRGFRALKTWFTLKAYGTERLGAVITRTCQLAQTFAERVRAVPALELLAPVSLNIVCFRHRGPQADDLNARIVVALQESGVAVPSTTIIGSALAIRLAVVNHRTRQGDLDALLHQVLHLGHQFTNKEDSH